MERGLAGGWNYQMTFPEQQQSVSAPPPNEIDIDDELPELPTTGLAGREQLVKQYYNEMSKMRGFAKMMTEQQIDPFEPDYTQDGGGLAYQTMQKLQANLMHTANALKNELEFEKQTRDFELRGQARLKPGVSREGLYYSDPNNFYTTAIDPVVTEANKQLGDARYTQDDSDMLNQTVRDPRVDYYEDLINKDPNNATLYQRQIKALIPNTPQTYAPSLNPRKDSDDTNKYQYQIELLKKYTNLKNGAWTPGSFSKAIENGKVFLKNEEGKGDLMGKYNAGPDRNGNIVYKDKVVDSWLKDPESGKVYIKFTDPKIPMEEASNLSGDAVTRTFVSNNSKFGSVDKLLEAAASQGYMRDGSSIDEALMPENFGQLQTEVNKAGIGAASKIKQEQEAIKKKLSTVKGAKVYANSESITLPDGRVMEIARHKYSDDSDAKRFFIRDFDQFESELHGDAESEDDDLQSEGLSADDIVKYLSKLGYFNQFLNATEQSATPTEQLSPRQQQAIEAFKAQLRREPTASERGKIMEKYK